MSDKIFLFDGDGVLIDFVAGFMTWARANVENLPPKSTILAYDLFSAITPKEKDAFWRMVDSTPGWVSDLKPRAGAFLALQQIRNMGHRVKCVTSPHIGPTWHYERHQWLVHNMDFAKDDIVFKSDKSCEFGHVFTDDYPGHVIGWRSRFVGKTFLMHEPHYNVPDNSGYFGKVHLTTDFAPIVDYADSIK